MWRFLMSGDLDLSHFQQKLGIPFTCGLWNVYTNFDFSTFFVFELFTIYHFTIVMMLYRTNGRMDKMCNASYRTAA